MKLPNLMFRCSLFITSHQSKSNTVRNLKKTKKNNHLSTFCLLSVCLNNERISFRFSASGFLNVYLVDAVSGSLVFHCSHKKAKGPVNVVHSENWIMVINYKIKMPQLSKEALTQGLIFQLWFYKFLAVDQICEI